MSPKTYCVKQCQVIPWSLFTISGVYIYHPPTSRYIGAAISATVVRAGLKSSAALGHVPSACLRHELRPNVARSNARAEWSSPKSRPYAVNQEFNKERFSDKDNNISSHKQRPRYWSAAFGNPVSIFDGFVKSLHLLKLYYNEIVRNPQIPQSLNS